MNTERNGLALAFIRSYPAAAARILEQGVTDEVADFLTTIPMRDAALILQQMLPQYGARIVTGLAPERAAGLVSRLTASGLAALLRYTKGRTRHKVLDALPAKTRGAAKLLLTYPENAVGAWMRAGIATVPTDTTAGEALQRAREQFDAGLDEPVLMIGRDRLVHGRVPLPTLLEARANAPLTTLHLPNPGQVSGRATLYSARNHSGWATSDLLVVTSQKKQLLGVLSHAALRKGLRQLSSDTDHHRSEDAVSSLVEAYSSSALALVGALGHMTGRAAGPGEWA